MSNSNNPNGIYSAMLYLDDEPQIQFVLDSINYNESIYVDAQVDYKYRYSGGAWLQHLSRLPGNRGEVYKELKSDGIINLTDTNQHLISVEVKDASHNTSILNFSVQHIDSLALTGIPAVETLHFIPNQVNEIKKPDIEIYLPAATFYDSVQTLYYRNNSSSPYSVSGIHQVNDESVPLHNDITVRIKPDKQIPENWKDKLIIQRSSRGKSVRKAKWDGQWLSATFGDLGIFQAFADMEAPQVNELGKGDTIDLSPVAMIVFTPVDNFGSIKNFRAELDSQWVRFTNDKSRNWIYTFDERCPFGIHHLKVTVEDLVGNVTEKSWWFKRYPYTPPKKKIVKKGTSKKRKVAGKKTKKK